MRKRMCSAVLAAFMTLSLVQVPAFAAGETLEPETTAEEITAAQTEGISEPETIAEERTAARTEETAEPESVAEEAAEAQPEEKAEPAAEELPGTQEESSLAEATAPEEEPALTEAASSEETSGETAEAAEEASAYAAPTSGACGDNLTWRLENGTLTISGTGPMGDYKVGEEPDWNGTSGIKQVVIETGVTTIGAYAFCGMKEVETVSIPDTVTEIHVCAFMESSVKEVTIPDSVTVIEGSAFAACTNLKKANIPDSVTTLGSYVFGECENLSEITLSKKLTEIPNATFNACSALETVVIPDGVTKITYRAFDGCKELRTVVIPRSVTSIESWAFYGDTKLNIFYKGTEEEWGNISIDKGSDNNEYRDGGAFAGGAKPTFYYNYTEAGTGAVYQTHVQSIGWQDPVSNGKVAGTSGKAKRLEGIRISAAGLGKLGVQYTTHVQSYGWLPWVSDGALSGTEGEAKRLEAVKIQLTGADKDKYDIYYRVHAQSYGWLGWAKNGEAAGTAGQAKRLEAIQILVAAKGTAINREAEGIKSVRKEAYIAKAGTSSSVSGADAPTVSYQTHVQSHGWQGRRYNGQMSGTSGEAKRLEAIKINVSNLPSSGGIIYRTHVQSEGWQDWKREGELSGTSGKAKRLEAIEIKLSGTMPGELADRYDVYYRVHAQSYGWLAWAKNGESAGTEGLAKRLEAIQIVLVPKGGPAPAANYGGITSVNASAFIKK